MKSSRPKDHLLTWNRTADVAPPFETEILGWWDNPGGCITTHQVLITSPDLNEFDEITYHGDSGYEIDNPPEYWALLPDNRELTVVSFEEKT